MTYQPVESQYSMTATRHGSWEPRRLPVDPSPVNPTYPSCPFGVRVTDLPVGWSTAGRSAPPTIVYEGAKLRPDDVATIRNTSTAAVTLARRFGVTPKTIYRVRQGRTWKEGT